MNINGEGSYICNNILFCDFCD